MRIRGTNYFEPSVASSASREAKQQTDCLDYPRNDRDRTTARGCAMVNRLLPSPPA
jgi:hypothetical protein